MLTDIEIIDDLIYHDSDSVEIQLAWNRLKENMIKIPCIHFFNSTDGVHCVLVDRCGHPDTDKWSELQKNNVTKPMVFNCPPVCSTCGQCHKHEDKCSTRL